uniref:uncharacterized protein LOC122608413 n=1 Tax=Erigeron canadensis TaxID=72917 RepID=UPI001CB8FA64|nr:uncharacterized protein LOC122608413 [Erigeron canadensis]
MEMCSEALEETITSEEAHILFDKAASKFHKVAALAFFNWGNVHMCAARKRIPIDDSGDKAMVATRFQGAYEWVMNHQNRVDGLEMTLDSDDEVIVEIPRGEADCKNSIISSNHQNINTEEDFFIYMIMTYMIQVSDHGTKSTRIYVTIASEGRGRH